MKRAGNIFDAAVSCLICNSVTQTQSMGLLGGFLMTIYQSNGSKSFVIDAQMTSPIEFRLPIDNLTDVKEGRLAIAVPGFIKGLWIMHKNYGSVPWRNLVQPVINLCNDGIMISKHFYDSLSISNISSDPYMRRIFFNEETKSFLKPGIKVKLGKVCKFLELLRDHKSEEIYSGKVGNVLVEDFKDAGSVIQHKDLRRYQVKIGGEFL
jgi:gamma-glutamyltranspeptidase